jgi:hypothetical protein
MWQRVTDNWAKVGCWCAHRLGSYTSGCRVQKSANGKFHLPSREALVITQERALVQHQTLTDIADGVLERRIRFGV